MIKSDFNRRRFLELAAGSFLGVSSSNLFGAAGEKSSVAPSKSLPSNWFTSTWEE